MPKPSQRYASGHVIGNLVEEVGDAAVERLGDQWTVTAVGFGAAPMIGRRIARLTGRGASYQRSHARFG